MDAAAFSSAVAQFSTKFCNELDNTTNIVCSPLSAENLLALLTLGSTDPARTELLKALGFPDNDDHKSIRSTFGALNGKLKAIKGVTLLVANKIYIKDGGYEVEPELKKDAEDIFDTEFEKINFKDSASAAQLINQWVEHKTKNQIKDLFSSSSFSAFTRLVLVNALYFKGVWKNQFNPKDTIKQVFHLDDKKTVKIPMMFKEQKFNYYASPDLQAQLLEVSYAGEETSMVFILPDDIVGLNAVMQNLADGHDLMSEIKKMTPTKVKATLPKFKVETEIDLTKLLPQLGIKAIFNKDDSGLSELLSPAQEVYVTEAIQKVYIEVNETGGEGGDGSGIDIRSISFMADAETRESAYFRADHPFLYLLMGPDNTILFIGAYRGN
ncbi:serine protease inhibitor 3/4 [Manduca sexta]|uniref:serine protease inhibitor 3/4 n=1 Tax=Manduca sexta TaxID=7130 RepID=UPI00188E9227|nr:serine protease inhibitor 3/4 [Manduca sexta]XP_037300616.1 serine protease inhibitor 3/4 [Manduca sexta]